MKQYGEEGLADGNPFGATLLLGSSFPACLIDLMIPVFLLGRIGHPRDMAGVGKPISARFACDHDSSHAMLPALFLASPASAYVSGTQIILDGAATHSRTKAAL